MSVTVRILPSTPRPDRWKGFVLGVIGSTAGLALMDAFFAGLERLGASEADDSDDAGGEADETEEATDASTSGAEEDATVTLGRVLYREIRGREPGPETAEVLGSLVHYGYGALMGGIYGAVRADRHHPDLEGGLAWGTVLWLLGDELVVPLLGLSEGPAERPIREHTRELAGHLVYGAGTAVATQALHRVT